MSRLISRLVGLGLLALPLVASAGEPDKRVGKALNKLKLNYEVDEDGDYKLLFHFDDRSQLVWVSSSTDEYGDLETRRVFSFGLVLPEGQTMSDEVYRKLLDGGYKIGGWSVEGQRLATFSQAIEAKAKPKALLATLHAVASTADEVELELTGDEDDL